jgi:negative regulator of sigma E activity
MNFLLPTLVALSAGTFVCILVKAWAQPILAVVLGASVCLAFVTLIIVYKGDIIAQRDNSAGTLNYSDVPQAISKEDHKFLDDLLQQQDQDNQRQTNSVPGQNFAKADSDSKSVPRAELVVNTSEVKRAQLVVNGRIVERAEPVRHRDQ